MRLRPASVRARTTTLATAMAAVVLVTGAVLLVTTLDRSLTRSGDDVARARAHDLGALAADGALPRRLDNVGDEGVAQVVDGSANVLAASSNIEGRPAITAFRPTGSEPVVRTFDAPDDGETERYRVWVLAAQGPDGPVTVYVGRSLESVREASATLRGALLVGVPALLALMAAVTWLVIGRTLRPVEDIREMVATISDRDLDRRVPVSPAGDEVSRLARTMNEMLDRLEEASRRQRDFVADASHELQSPITSMRTQLEVALAHPDNDWPSLAARLLGDADEMERLVRDLLFLARIQDEAPPRRELVDLDDLVLEEAARLRQVADVDLDTRQVSAAPVEGVRDELRRLVRNLLENAVRHARSAVRVTLVTGDTTARLDVCDDGPGVAPQDRERVFDRFYSADDSRTRGSGSGLGLAIARSVATRHAGTLEVVDAEPGACFVLTVPASSAPPGDLSHNSLPSPIHRS